MISLGTTPALRVIIDETGGAMRKVIALTLGLTWAASPENWPQWRGMSGTGVSTEKALPTEWNRDRNIAWRTDLKGLGVSSPVVWGDRVFVTYQIGAGALRQGTHPTFVQDG